MPSKPASLAITSNCAPILWAWNGFPAHDLKNTGWKPISAPLSATIEKVLVTAKPLPLRARGRDEGATSGKREKQIQPRRGCLNSLGSNRGNLFKVGFSVLRHPARQSRNQKEEGSYTEDTEIGEAIKTPRTFTRKNLFFWATDHPARLRRNRKGKGVGTQRTQRTAET